VVFNNKTYSAELDWWKAPWSCVLTLELGADFKKLLEGVINVELFRAWVTFAGFSWPASFKVQRF
jgi:hypothetical protein